MEQLQGGDWLDVYEDDIPEDEDDRSTNFEALIDLFYHGNFSRGIETMKEHGVQPSSVINRIQYEINQEKFIGYNWWGISHFSLSWSCSLGIAYYE